MENQIEQKNVNAIGGLMFVGSILLFIFLTVLPFIIIYYVVKKASK